MVICGVKTQTESYTVICNYKQINFKLVRRTGQRNLRLRVDSQGEVVVSAPYEVSFFCIKEFVEKNADWIEKQKSKAVQRTWTTGQTLLLNGITVILHISAGKTCVFQNGNMLYVTVRNPENVQAVRKAVCVYYCNEILAFAEKRVPYWCGLLGIEVPEILTGHARTRWGVCNIRDRKITFSAMTACLDDSLKDLVVFHEVCHLLCRGHQDDFHNLMQTYMPDVKEREKRLRIFNRSGATENLF